MRGMNRTNGKRLEGMAHLHQSLTDLFTTSPGERVERPEYGSRVPDLVDEGVTPGLIAALTAAIAEAVDRWEPRLHVTEITAAQLHPGKLDLTVIGYLKSSGEPVRLENIIV